MRVPDEDFFRTKNPLERRYGLNHLHFITCSCFQRLPLLGAPHTRNLFLIVLNEIRAAYDFALLGYVVMPEHFHFLISEPNLGTPSTVLQMLKQRVSRTLRLHSDQKNNLSKYPSFWQRRFYDFNVFTADKRREKLNYMQFNPVKRGLVSHPRDWEWSSYRFYFSGEAGLCTPNPDWKILSKS